MYTWITAQQMLDYYRRVKRINDRSMDMMGHHTQEPRIVTDNSGDYMVTIDPVKDTNPRTVQHMTTNGAGLVARILRGTR